MSNTPVSLLLVEDDELDVETFRRAMRKQQFEIDVQLATDGSSALRHLRESSQDPSPTDFVVVLDLNMPGMNGHEFLEELRSDAALKNTTVFVLTSSEHERDIQAAYERNVAGYFLKSDVHSFVSTLAQYIPIVKRPLRR